MRKLITMKELETIIAAKPGDFDAESADTYGFSICMLCNGVHFEKSMDDEEEYISMILVCKCGEMQIEANIIEEIFLQDDGTITIVFKRELPDLKISYRK